MSNRGKKPSPEKFTYVSYPELCERTGMTPTQMDKFLAKHGHWLGDGREDREIAVKPRHQRERRYDVALVDVILALHGKAHRQLEEPETDWLTKYQETNSDRSQRSNLAGPHHRGHQTRGGTSGGSSRRGRIPAPGASPRRT